MQTQIDYTKYTMTALAPDLKEEEVEHHLNDEPELTSRMRELLEDAEVYYHGLYDLRKRRRRNREFYRGRQWSDLITDPEDGKIKTEETKLLEDGKQPLVNNQLRQLVKTLLGQFRGNDYLPQAKARKREHAGIDEMMSNAIQHEYGINKLTEVDVRVFEEFLMSGVICWRGGYAYKHERNQGGVCVDVPNPNYLFWNNEVRDIRGKDLKMIGQIVDAPLTAIVSAFAKSTEEAEIIRKWYSAYESERPTTYSQQGSDREDNMEFYYPLDSHLCRYYEIWKLEYKQKVICHDWLEGDQYQHPLSNQEAIDMVEQENEMRLMEAMAQFALQGIVFNSLEEFMVSEFGQNVPLIDYEIKPFEPVWCFYQITPLGQVLDSGETPYEHECHPFTLRLYPLIDGEVWGFMEDIIDQQKMINRMITLIDFVISAGAKGVLMVPEDVIPEGITADDFSDEWRRHNGVIVYKPGKHGKIPEQIANSSMPVGVVEMLQFQLSAIKEISGVNGAMQGQEPDAGTPASRYAMEAQNSSLSSKDYFDFFFSARLDRDEILMKLVKQFYTEERFLNVAGVDYSEEASVYVPEKVADVDFDLVVTKSANAPTYRMLIDDYLLKFLESGMIDLPMFLENTSLPFANNLMQKLRERQEQMQGQPIDPAKAQMLQQMVGDAPSVA